MKSRISCTNIKIWLTFVLALGAVGCGDLGGDFYLARGIPVFPTKHGQPTQHCMKSALDWIDQHRPCGHGADFTVSTIKWQEQPIRCEAFPLRCTFGIYKRTSRQIVLWNLGPIHQTSLLHELHHHYLQGIGQDYGDHEHPSWHCIQHQKLGWQDWEEDC